jgi:hypothetical protein
MKNYRIVLLFFLFGCLVAGCNTSSRSDKQKTVVLPSSTPAQPASIATLSPTIIVSPTTVPSLTPLPSLLPTSSPTPSQTPSPTSNPNPTVTDTLVHLPILAKTPLLQPVEPITLGNTGRIVEWARWGNGTIRDAAWSSDGKWLAISSQIGLVLYDAETMEEAWYVAGEYIKMSFSPNGQWLIISDRSGDIGWYDVITGEKIRSSHNFAGWSLVGISLSRWNDTVLGREMSSFSV